MKLLLTFLAGALAAELIRRVVRAAGPLVRCGGLDYGLHDGGYYGG